MKVIHEIIDYLLSKNIIDDEDREYLRAKGVYPKLNYDHFDSEPYYYPDAWYGIDDDLINKSNVDEEFFQMEQDLEKKRNVKRKPRKRIKKSKLDPNQKKIVEDALSTIKKISWRPPVIINTHEDGLVRLINNYAEDKNVANAGNYTFSDIGEFWEWAYSWIKWVCMLSDNNEILDTFSRFSEETIKLLSKKQNKRKSAYIRPAAYIELCCFPELDIVMASWELTRQFPTYPHHLSGKDSHLFENADWRLAIPLQDGRHICITDEEGKLILKKVKTLIH